ncbi:DUF6388 family protein [Burkholderia sp. BCC1972]|uniref:DUF6388 family protein n=1 Tax=Burkholderia sp. BCC1972 TaxID=2817438 RepID=UPI002ABDB386|nr:DUF6388 family protein [Burkholderia sp. BCC1972]
MSLSFLSDQQITSGYEQFLSKFPKARARVNEISQEVADMLGVKLDELRQVETAKALDEVAKSHNIDPFEYLLQFAVDNESERNEILRANREAMERAIGLR